MATTVRTLSTKSPAKGSPMSPTRKTALVAGIFYLITFISIPTLALYGPVKNHGTGSSVPAATLPCSWAASSR